MPRRSSASDGKSVGSGKYVELAGKWGAGEQPEDAARWDWAKVDGNNLWLLITLVGRHRGACMCGVDRQGVGGTLSVWLGGERVLNKWYSPKDVGYSDFNLAVSEFIDDLSAIEN